MLNLACTICSTRSHHVSWSSTFKSDKREMPKTTILHSQIWQTRNYHIIIFFSCRSKKVHVPTFIFSAQPLQDTTDRHTTTHTNQNSFVHLQPVVHREASLELQRTTAPRSETKLHHQWTTTSHHNATLPCTITLHRPSLLG